MLNLLLLPLVTVTGAVTANLTDFVRGEATEYHKDLNPDTLTFYLAVGAYILVWFGLLVSGIELTAASGLASGIEYIGLFVAGLVAYMLFKGGRFLSNSAQMWVWRLSFPLVLLTSALAIYLS
ncbi:hypothetical protein [Shewanella sp. GXUN23E]|uniref:hypothetical protein n=1 Tax=Shewanella sp. GXUN23E TaxID=3422498 RepID=UPI003D7CFD9A